MCLFGTQNIRPLKLKHNYTNEISRMKNSLEIKVCILCILYLCINVDLTPIEGSFKPCIQDNGSTLYSNKHICPFHCGLWIEIRKEFMDTQHKLGWVELENGTTKKKKKLVIGMQATPICQKCNG